VVLGLSMTTPEFGNKPNTKWLAMACDMYAQDSWKPTRNLTLELGLRYSLWQPEPRGLRLHHVARRQSDDADRDAVPVLTLVNSQTPNSQLPRTQLPI
jgi:hypothetical protein